MQGLRSRNPVILPLDTEIERTIRQKFGDNFEEEEEELQEEKAIAEQHVNQPQLVNQHVNISNKRYPHRVLGLINMGNRE
jgi:hypothetical protein